MIHSKAFALLFGIICNSILTAAIWESIQGLISTGMSMYLIPLAMSLFMLLVSTRVFFMEES